MPKNSFHTKALLPMLCLALILLTALAPSAPLFALGHWGSVDGDDTPGGDTPETEETIAEDELIEIDEEDEDIEIEVDENLPAALRGLKAIEPLEPGDLASRALQEGDELVLENDRLALYFNEENLNLKVERKESSYLWSSSPDPEDWQGLSGVWQAFVQAPVVLDYLEPGNPSATWRDVPELKGTREIPDGIALDLNFPRVSVDLTLELRLEDDALVAEVRDDSIRYLTVSDELKKQTAAAENEEIVVPEGAAPEGAEDGSPLDDGSDFLGDIPDAVPEGESLIEDSPDAPEAETESQPQTDPDAEIPAELPEEEGTGRADDNPYIITRMYLFPFLGSVADQETTGYLFIPDGPGALIRFSQARRYANNFTKRIYGTDRAVTRPTYTLTRLPRVDEPAIHMPVYGISHGHKQEAYLAVIESGQDYADISATPAGVKTQFYWAGAIFNYNEPFFQRTGRGGEGFRYVRREMNEVDPRIRFHFLGDQDADYVGMARAYRRDLESRDRLPEVTPDPSLPLLIQAYMADQEQGLFFHKTRPMTRAEDLLNWLPELHELAGTGLHFDLIGAQDKGESGYKLGDLRPSGKLGSWDDFFRALEEEGVPLALRSELAKGYDPQLSRFEMVYNIDRSIAHENTEDGLFRERYFLNFPTQTRIVEAWEKSAPRFAIDAGSLGSTLLSDYKDNRHFGRHEARRGLSELLESSGIDFTYQAPNDYLWRSASAVYDLPTQHSQYLYEHDTVPFLQIVLSGKMPLFGEALNFGAAQKQDLLTRMDYGLAPSFLVTEASPTELQNANRQDIYYSEFSRLLPEIQSSYEALAEVLGPVQGLSITDREILSKNLVLTTYEDGQRVLVNYDSLPQTFEGETIEGESGRLLPPATAAADDVMDDEATTEDADAPSAAEDAQPEAATTPLAGAARDAADSQTGTGATTRKTQDTAEPQETTEED